MTSYSKWGDPGQSVYKSVGGKLFAWPMQREQWWYFGDREHLTPTTKSWFCMSYLRTKVMRSRKVSASRRKISGFGGVITDISV
jgi:hypothetical protein